MNGKPKEAALSEGFLTRTVACGVLFFILWLQVPASLAQADSSLARLTESFAHPPDDCRIMMRWWWFGPAITKPEIQRELEQMKAAGIGGVEIATLYPLALDEPQSGFHEPPLSFRMSISRTFALQRRKPEGLECESTLPWEVVGLLAVPTFRLRRQRVKCGSRYEPFHPGAARWRSPALDFGRAIGRRISGSRFQG